MAETQANRALARLDRSEKNVAGSVAPSLAATLWLLASVAAVVTYAYVTIVDFPNLGPRQELHNQILMGGAPAPYQYRVLVPLFGEAMTRLFMLVTDRETAFALAYIVYDFCAVLFLLAMLHRWLRVWFTHEQALIGVLFVGATLPIALRDHYFQPWSLLEAGLFTAALDLIYRRREWLTAAVVLLASLNRETGIFIALAYLAVHIPWCNRAAWRTAFDRRTLGFLMLYLALWAAAFAGLRLIFGQAPPVETLESILALNLAPGAPLNALLNIVLFLGAFWIFAILGFKRAPYFLRSITVIVPLYLVTILVWGVWYEVRLLMPLYPILVPLALAYLFPTDKRRVHRNGPGRMNEGNLIYWFGGSPCAGKSSVADRLAAQYGLMVYRCDDAFGAHIERCNAIDHPDMYAVAHMSWEEIWMRPVPVQVESVLALYREEFGMILEDLRTLPVTSPILIEGCALLPELVATQITDVSHAIWFIPARNFQRTHYAQRGFVRDVLAQVSDPDQAWENWMNRDQQFGERVAADAAGRGYTVEWVDGRRSIEELTEMVTEQWGLC